MTCLNDGRKFPSGYHHLYLVALDQLFPTRSTRRQDSKRLEKGSIVPGRQIGKVEKLFMSAKNKRSATHDLTDNVCWSIYGDLGVHVYLAQLLKKRTSLHGEAAAAYICLRVIHARSTLEWYILAAYMKRTIWPSGPRIALLGMTECSQRPSLSILVRCNACNATLKEDLSSCFFQLHSCMFCPYLHFCFSPLPVKPARPKSSC